MDARQAANHVVTGLKSYYAKYVLPIHKHYQCDKFVTPLSNDADFMTKPMVLLRGQVDTTIFIRYLLERDFPGTRIRLEPTAYTFVPVLYDTNERAVPRNAAVPKDKPFKALETFGMSFLNDFEVQTHDACTHEEAQLTSTDSNFLLHLKPSIGKQCGYCVCTIPPFTEYYVVDSIPDEPTIEKDDDTSSLYVYKEITQDDFSQSGTYTVVEDITADFSEDQATDYPGAHVYRNAFFLGFFAGITIECDDVTLDPGAYTLRMSDYFCYRQRWFSTMELSTQYFLPGQVEWSRLCF